MAERTPAKHKPSVSKLIKRMRAKSSDKMNSLRQFARNSDNEKVKSIAGDWFHNKTANFSKPPLGIGRTRKKKNK